MKKMNLNFRDKNLALKLSEKIKKEAPCKEIKIMEVCGTHTQVIEQFGIRQLIPENIELLSGPGCPVCVTSTREIDEAIELAKKDITITTFGDMLRVRGSRKSLNDMKTEGRDVRIVYSISDSVKIAREHPEKEVVHIAIGFETTAPSTACELLLAPENFSVLSCHRLIPPAMEFLLSSEKVQIDGFICPGHVSTIIGVTPYQRMSEKFSVPQVIAGFEPIDVLIAIEMLLEMLNRGEVEVKNEYTRIVRPEGNLKAKEVMNKVFHLSNVDWRGFPEIKKSGLKLRKKFSRYDARKKFKIKVKKPKEPKGCICGKVLKGISSPRECKLFGKVCNPENPVGPCMVSSEGSCGIVYRYGIKK